MIIDNNLINLYIYSHDLKLAYKSTINVAFLDNNIKKLIDFREQPKTSDNRETIKSDERK